MIYRLPFPLRTLMCQSYCTHVCYFRSTRGHLCSNSDLSANAFDTKPMRPHSKLGERSRRWGCS